MSIINFDDTNQATLEEPNSNRMANPIGSVERPLQLTLVSWIAALRSRGVSFAVTNNRLRVSPWRKLSTGDQTMLRQHRDAIKKLIREGMPGLPAAPSVGKSAAAVDRDAQLKKHDLESWRVIHHNDRDEIERRRVEATSLMTRVSRPACLSL